MDIHTDIPLATGHQRSEEETNRRRLEAVRSTVLVVEDDPASRELLVEMLSIWGYDAVPVGSAEEAEFATRSKLFAAAVVDVFLPGKSGAALMAKLRERFPEAILIGMSALGDSAMARRCKGQGADLFISKPIRLEELADALKSQHQSWH